MKNRRFKLVLSWVFICSVLSFYYSNCESYSSSTIRSTPPIVEDDVNKSCEDDPETSECIKEKAEMYELHKGFIYLTINGSNTIQMTQYDKAVNVSGSCYQDVFKKTEIYYRLVNDAQNALFISNNPTKSYTGSNIQCVNGQWGFSIYLNESEVTYVGTTSLFQKTQSHTLIVEMVVRDENNTLYQNLSTAQDSIGLTPSL
jgi:hypothetical protein